MTDFELSSYLARRTPDRAVRPQRMIKGVLRTLQVGDVCKLGERPRVDIFCRSREGCKKRHVQSAMGAVA